MSTPGADIETLLSRALQPVDPPDGLSSRLESTLVDLTEAAVVELESWELRAMRDPRNWVRPVVAVGAGGVATGALVLGLLGLLAAAGTPRRRVEVAERRRLRGKRQPRDSKARAQGA